MGTLATGRDGGGFRIGYIWWTVSAGLLFAAAALVLAPLIGLEISGALDNREGRVTWVNLFGGIFILGCLFWWLLMPRMQRVSFQRGAVTGTLTALFGYPVVLALAEIFQRSWHDPIGFGERVDRIFWITGLTLMTTGFAATLSMAAIGAVASFLLARLKPGATAPFVPRQRSAFVRGLQYVAGALAVAAITFLTISFAWLSLIPIDAAGLGPIRQTLPAARTHDEAVAAFESIRAAEDGLALHERCPSRLLTHGRKVERAIIYFHGLTACPAQGEQLADTLFALGYNVYLPRMFGHGEADPDTLSLADLTAEELIAMADESVNLAQGLGDEVIVTGLSAGGTIASWTAQYRGDVAMALPTSPFLGPYVLPPWSAHAATNLVLMLPDMVFLWNPLEPVTAPATDYVFPRPSLHTLAQVMRLGRIVYSSAQSTPPAARRIGVLLNEADVAVSNELTRQLIAQWQADGREVETRILPFSNHLPHDLISPHEIYGDIDLVYALLVEMMEP